MSRGDKNSIYRITSYNVCYTKLLRALAFDFLAIALAEFANVSERRTERLVNPALNNHLPAFLAPNGGLNSGFMIAQYSAAALVSENKVLAHPASVDSIPSSANQEDP